MRIRHEVTVDEYQLSINLSLSLAGARGLVLPVAHDEGREVPAVGVGHGGGAGEALEGTVGWSRSRGYCRHTVFIRRKHRYTI